MILPRGTPILPAFKTATTPPPAPTLNNFLGPETARLASSDAPSQSAARKAVEDGAVVSGTDASAVYLDAYSKAVNDRLLPLMKNADLRVRLNAAIAAGHIAAARNNTNVQLTPLALAAINDKSEPVSLWGVKAAKPLLPRLLEAKDRRADDMAKAIIAAVNRYPQSPALGEEAYDAMAGEAMTGGGTAAFPPARMGVVPHVLALLQTRGGHYRKAVQDVNAGAAMPAMPGSVFAEMKGMVFLSNHAYKSATPQQRTQIAQTIVGLMKTWVELSGPLLPKNPGAPSDEVAKDDILDLVKNGASAINVMSGLKLASQFRLLTDVKPNMEVSEIMPRVEALEEEMKKQGLLPPAPAGAPAAAVPAAGAVPTAGKR